MLIAGDTYKPELGVSVSEQEATGPVSLPRDRILCGDSLVLLSSLPSGTVDLVLTSPPYFRQRDYGGGIGNETSLQDYLEGLLSILGHCVRLLKPTGSIVINIGDKYAHRGLALIPYRFAVAAMERFPVRLVNAITWVKRNPTPRHFRRRLVSSTEPFHFVISDAYQYFPESFLCQTKPPDATRRGNRIGQRYFRLIEASTLTPDQKAQARLALENAIAEVRRGEIQDFRMKIRGIHSVPFGAGRGETFIWNAMASPSFACMVRDSNAMSLKRRSNRSRVVPTGLSFQRRS